MPTAPPKISIAITVAQGTVPRIGRVTVVEASIFRLCSVKMSLKVSDLVRAKRSIMPEYMITSPILVVRKALSPACFGVILLGSGYFFSNQKPISR